MSNLATMIMEGSNYGFGKANLAHSYDHEDGAGLIAMESAEALRDIFEAEFYVPNTCTIAAALEGASCVEESSQAAIMEASLKGAFEKIKQFFIKLKEKVKEFIHNIKRYLTGIFGNDVKWVTNYEKELKALSAKDLKGYKIKMYNYTIGETISKDELDKMSEELLNTVQSLIDKEIISHTGDSSEHGRGEEYDSDKFKAELDDDYEQFIKDLVGKSIDADELDKAIWSVLRDGASSESDKEDVEVAGNIKTFIDTIKSSPKTISAYDTMISKTESMYTKAINLVKTTEQKLGNSKYHDNGLTSVDIKSDQYKDEAKTQKYNTVTGTSSQISDIQSILRQYASAISKMQGVQNKAFTATKSAYVERNAAYKKALVGAFGYAKKNKKK